MEAKYHLSQQDFVAYNQRRCLRSIGIGAGFILLAVAILMLANRGSGALWDVLILLGAGGLMLALYLLLYLPYWSRGLFREQASLHEERTVTVEPAQISFSQSSGTLRTAWHEIVSWDETPRLLTLFLNRALFIPITKADVGVEVVDAIRSALKASGLERPRQRRRNKR